METHVEVPRAWEQLAVERLRGTLLVIGAPDVGKTTFARYLYQRLCELSRCVAYLDGDPGQSTLGPPATIGLSVGVRGDAAFPPKGPSWRSFVGAVSPQGHMLPLLVGASRLERAARAQGVDTTVYDTSGLVDPGQGGLALKQAEIDLLQPSVVFAIQRSAELESLLVPLRWSSSVRVIVSSQNLGENQFPKSTNPGFCQCDISPIQDIDFVVS